MPAKTKEARRLINKAYRERHKERLKLLAKERREKYPERGWDKHLRNRYGITFGQYLELLEFQRGLCGICGKPQAVAECFAVDHDHVTNRVRGLVHRTCNTAIGLFRDDPKMIRRALKYLKQPPFDRLSKY